MATRIEKDFTFQTAVHFEEKFCLNIYDITLSLLVETECAREQNVAMDRAIHFLQSVMQGSILVDQAEKDAIKKYKNAGLKICELPDEPYDQIIAMVILLKLNAIMENRLRVSDILLSSVIGGDIRYSIVVEVAENYFTGNNWWNDSTVSLNSEELSQQKTQDNVLKLFDDSHWVDLGLSWKEKVTQ